MAGSPISIQKIAQLSIRATDVERSADFYANKLGLPLLFTQAGMAVLECSGVRLLLSVPEKPQFDHPSSIIYFQVPDLDEAHRSLTAQGVEFLSKPHKVAEFGGYAIWMAFFHDPDENVHALTSEVPL